MIANKLRKQGNNLITTDLMMDGVDIHSDITQLPFADQSFNAVICSHVLEHIPDDRTAMSELGRILNSEGYALIIVPKDREREQTYEDDSITSPEARRREFGQEDHVRCYGKDFVQRLSENGFDVTIEDYVRKLDSEIVNRYGLKSYHIHLCTKSTDSGS
jgi:predicted SAM-dependent methyltransferase